MSRKRMQEIDSEKLLKALTTRGLSCGGVSRKLGHDSSYIKHCLNRGGIPLAEALVLESLYNIKLDDLKKEEVEEEPAVIPDDKPKVYVTDEQWRKVIIILTEMVRTLDSIEAILKSDMRRR